MTDLDFLDDPNFKHGVELGKSLGSYDTTREALAAHRAGEIELWLEFMEPKTLEDWDAFYAKYDTTHEDMKTRWIKPEKAD